MTTTVYNFDDGDPFAKMRQQKPIYPNKDPRFMCSECSGITSSPNVEEIRSVAQSVFDKKASERNFQIEKDNFLKKIDIYIGQKINDFIKELEEINKKQSFEKVLKEFTSRFHKGADIDLPMIFKSNLSEENKKKFNETYSMNKIKEGFPNLFKDVLLKVRASYLSSEKFQIVIETLRLIINKTTNDPQARLSLNKTLEKTINEFSSSFSILNHYEFRNNLTHIVLGKSSV